MFKQRLYPDLEATHLTPAKLQTSAVKLLVVKYSADDDERFKQLQKKTEPCFLHHSNVLVNQSNIVPQSVLVFGLSLSGGNLSLAFKVSSTVCCFSAFSFRSELGELDVLDAWTSKVQTAYSVCSYRTALIFLFLGWSDPLIPVNGKRLDSDLDPMIETGSGHSCYLSNEQNQNGKAVCNKQNLS